MSDGDADFYSGKLHAARYYLEWELPQAQHLCKRLAAENSIAFDMDDAWF